MHAGGVHAVHGFVKDEQVRVFQEGGSKSEALAHAEGIATDRTVRSVREAKAFESGIDGRIFETGSLGKEHKVLFPGKQGKKIRTIKDPPDTLHSAPETGTDDSVINADLALRGPDKPEHTTEEGCFSRPVRAKQTKKASLGDSKGEVIEGDDLVGFLPKKVRVINLGEIFRFQNIQPGSSCKRGGRGW